MNHNRLQPMSPAPEPLREEPSLEDNLRKMKFWNTVGIAACVFGLIVLAVFNHFCPNCK
jgi:hypothetical protein